MSSAKGFTRLRVSSRKSSCGFAKGEPVSVSNALCPSLLMLYPARVSVGRAVGGIREFPRTTSRVHCATGTTSALEHVAARLGHPHRRRSDRHAGAGPYP